MIEIEYKNDLFVVTIDIIHKDPHFRLLKDAGFERTHANGVTKRLGYKRHMYLADDPHCALAYLEATKGRPDAPSIDMTVWNEIDRYAKTFENSALTNTKYMPPAPANCHYLPFQRAGIEYALERQHTLIGDQPGLGKTIQAIGFCNSLEAKRILVVCPASLRLNWQREIYKWSIQVKRRETKIWPVMSGEDGLNPYSVYNICSYNLFQNDVIYRTALKIDWDVIIFDEAHYLKNPEALRTARLLGNAVTKGVASRGKRILALTGTPLPNRPREAYTLARALCFDAIDWVSRESFELKYNPSTTFTSGYTSEDTSNLLELQARMRCNYMVRRLKEDVLHDLPDKMYELSYIDISTNEAKIKRILRKERMLDFQVKDLINPHAAIFGQISTLRREMGEAMVPGIIKHIEMIMDGGLEKLVVFAHHRSVIYALNQLFEKKGIGHVAIHGQTPVSYRQKLVDEFQEDDSVSIFLGQLQAAGTGITLTAASQVLLAEGSWVPGENEQAIDRTHRIGQKSSVLAQFLVVEGSISEKILGRAIDKSHNIHRALDSNVNNHQG